MRWLFSEHPYITSFALLYVGLWLSEYFGQWEHTENDYDE